MTATTLSMVIVGDRVLRRLISRWCIAVPQHSLDGAHGIRLSGDGFNDHLQTGAADICGE
jgi:hypothetical protein